MAKSKFKRTLHMLLLGSLTTVAMSGVSFVSAARAAQAGVGFVSAAQAAGGMDRDNAFYELARAGNITAMTAAMADPTKRPSVEVMSWLFPDIFANPQTLTSVRAMLSNIPLYAAYRPDQDAVDTAYAVAIRNGAENPIAILTAMHDVCNVPMPNSGDAFIAAAERGDVDAMVAVNAYQAVNPATVNEAFFRAATALNERGRAAALVLLGEYYGRLSDATIDRVRNLDAGRVSAVVLAEMPRNLPA